MKFLLCLTALLTACPTPPESANTNKSESAVQNNKEQQNNPNQQNNKRSGNNNGDEKGAPPPTDGTNSTQGDTPPPANGAPLINGEPSQNELLNGNNNIAKMEANLVKPEAGEEEGDGSAIGMYNDIVNANNVLQTQDEIKKGEHITLSGKITCNGDKCTSDLILRMTSFVMPTENNNPISQKPEKSEQPNASIEILTEKSVNNNDTFSILAPKSDQKVVLELLLDQDKNGKASQGESFVIYEGGGGIELLKDLGAIEFKFNPRDMEAPLSGGPN